MNYSIRNKQTIRQWRFIPACIAISMCLLLFFTLNVQAAYTYVTGGSSKGAATYVSTGPEYATEISGSDDVYFKFTTPAQKGYFDFYAKNNDVECSDWDNDRYVHFTLTTTLNEQIADLACKENNDSSCNLQLEPSTTYYLKIQNMHDSDDISSISGYVKFKFTYTADTEADSKETAKLVSMDKKNLGSYDGLGDEDYFKFKTGAFKSYIFKSSNINVSTNSWDTDRQFKFGIYSAINEEIYVNTCAYGENASNTVTLQPNTVYYIKVWNAQYDDSYGGTGNYSFSISPIRTSLTKANVSYASIKTYTGKAIRPAVSVSYNGKKLASGKDYTVSYSNNVKPGIGYIIIKGRGSYTSTLRCSFTIKPMAEKIARMSNPSSGKIKVIYSRQNYVTGYQVQYSKQANYRYSKTYVTKKNTAVLRADRGYKYYVRVRSYVKSANKVTYGSWSASKAVYVKR